MKPSVNETTCDIDKRFNLIAHSFSRRNPHHAIVYVFTKINKAHNLSVETSITCRVLHVLWPEDIKKCDTLLYDFSEKAYELENMWAPLIKKLGIPREKKHAHRHYKDEEETFQIRCTNETMEKESYHRRFAHSYTAQKHVTKVNTLALWEIRESWWPWLDKDLDMLIASSDAFLYTSLLVVHASTDAIYPKNVRKTWEMEPTKYIRISPTHATITCS